MIQQTIREQLPEGFQKAEYLLAHGMIDMVVHRHKLRETLSRLCRMLSPAAALSTSRALRLATAPSAARRAGCSGRYLRLSSPACASMAMSWLRSACSLLSLLPTPPVERSYSTRA